ncbi:MAG: hypothetical protein IKU01_02460 [Bacteroidales bacterium]|nr:hypothetical protein [Bacteroidales bacterium]
MKTESDKFENTTVISHHDNCGDPNCTLPDTGAKTDTGSKWWQDIVKDTVTTGLGVVSNLFGGSGNSNTPAPTVNNNVAKDNTALYVGLGAGALMFIVLILVLLKK